MPVAFGAPTPAVIGLDLTLMSVWAMEGHRVAGIMSLTDPHREQQSFSVLFDVKLVSHHDISKD